MVVLRARPSFNLFCDCSRIFNFLGRTADISTNGHHCGHPRHQAPFCLGPRMVSKGNGLRSPYPLSLSCSNFVLGQSAYQCCFQGLLRNWNRLVSRSRRNVLHRWNHRALETSRAERAEDRVVSLNPASRPETQGRNSEQSARSSESVSNTVDSAGGLKGAGFDFCHPPLLQPSCA